MPQPDGKPTPDIVALRLFFRDAMARKLGHHDFSEMHTKAIYWLAEGLAALVLGHGDVAGDWFEAAIWTGTTADLIADTWPT